MSSNVWPALPLRRLESQRTPVYATSVFTSESQVEQRFSHQASPRFRYRLRYTVRTSVNAPGTWSAYSEKAIVQKFVDDHLGEWDSFLFDDPWDAAQRRVRFDGLPQFTQIVPGVWDAEIGLVSVLS
jgi:hypothetical protein